MVGDNDLREFSHPQAPRPFRPLLIRFILTLTTWSSGLGTGLQSPARGFDSRRGLLNSKATVPLGAAFTGGRIFNLRNKPLLLNRDHASL
jgi:hypothetical protein